MSVKLLVFAGSLRRDSYNKRLARAAARAAEAAGAQVSYIELNDYPMPIYDGDLEATEGPPLNAFRLQELIAEQQGLIVASPEYNHSIPALLKNTLDWVSRTPRVRGANPFAGKPALILSASPGDLGGIQGQDHLRRVLTTVGALVLPQTLGLPRADAAFDAEGRLREPELQERLDRLVRQLVRVAARLAD
ncbi:MAG: NAD(P)H-dependent oxidoreductase [Thiobacillaceae bacterium]|nr:NAD(P)H-dependent oxidoreductase [Thiobacillaceae bacterium]